MRLIAGMMMFLGCGMAFAAPSNEQLAAYRALVQQDLRLATIGYRLASASTRFCERRERNPGWALHDESQYPDREIARAAFVLRHPVAVSAVVPDGPAERLGIKAGDGLVAINDAVLNIHTEIRHNQTARRIETVEQELRQALKSGGPVRITLETEGGQKQVILDPPEICASRFWVDTRSGLDAGADGDGVRVTSGLLAFTGNDDVQLAAVVAHELSHNLLGHSERLKSAKRSTKEVLATEIEADRLSVWLMKNAGYDPVSALRFAERYGRKTGLGIFSDGTHLRWRNRVKVMQSEIDLMAAAVSKVGVLSPPLLTDGKLDTP